MFQQILLPLLFIFIIIIILLKLNSLPCGDVSVWLIMAKRLNAQFKISFKILSQAFEHHSHSYQQLSIWSILNYRIKLFCENTDLLFHDIFVENKWFPSKETVRCVSKSQACFNETMTFQYWLICCNHNMRN